MPKKRFSAEQIVVLLRQIEVLTSQGKTPAVACREAGISQQSYYRWRKEYGGLEVDQARRMKDLERENNRTHADRLQMRSELDQRCLKIVRSKIPRQMDLFAIFRRSLPIESSRLSLAEPPISVSLP
jgi:putative transposase